MVEEKKREMENRSARESRGWGGSSVPIHSGVVTQDPGLSSETRDSYNQRTRRHVHSCETCDVPAIYVLGTSTSVLRHPCSDIPYNSDVNS